MYASTRVIRRAASAGRRCCAWEAFLERSSAAARTPISMVLNQLFSSSYPTWSAGERVVSARPGAEEANYAREARTCPVGSTAQALKRTHQQIRSAGWQIEMNAAIETRVWRANWPSSSRRRTALEVGISTSFLVIQAQRDPRRPAQRTERDSRLRPRAGGLRRAAGGRTSWCGADIRAGRPTADAWSVDVGDGCAGIECRQRGHSWHRAAVGVTPSRPDPMGSGIVGGSVTAERCASTRWPP